MTRTISPSTEWLAQIGVSPKARLETGYIRQPQEIYRHPVAGLLGLHAVARRLDETRGFIRDLQAYARLEKLKEQVAEQLGARQSVALLVRREIDGSPEVLRIVDGTGDAQHSIYPATGAIAIVKVQGWRLPDDRCLLPMATRRTPAVWVHDAKGTREISVEGVSKDTLENGVTKESSLRAIVEDMTERARNLEADSFR